VPFLGLLEGMREIWGSWGGIGEGVGKIKGSLGVGRSEGEGEREQQRGGEWGCVIGSFVPRLWLMVLTLRKTSTYRYLHP
jgi:hypothetical protein